MYTCMYMRDRMQNIYLKKNCKLTLAAKDCWKN